MTEPPAPVEPEAFRKAIARWATGVAVVTGHENGQDAGLTVNALLSISLRPPLLLVSLTHDADSTPVIERTQRFGVSLLNAEQRWISERFAKALPGAEKFDGVPVSRGLGGVPLLEGALATFVCRLEQMIPLADHHLLVGAVVAAEGGTDGLPLLFYRSRYGDAADPDMVRLAPRA
jgi:flavin reductase (DIM6/NTAB) family NADH-FMN oxidoreductase RutF